MAVVLLTVGALGLSDKYLLGAAPTGLAPGDYLLFFGLGAAAALGAVLPHADRPIWADQDPDRARAD